MYRWVSILVVGTVLLMAFTSGGAATPSDADDDGISNKRESALGWNPNDPDMDNDGLTDGREMNLGTNPKNKDSDLDGVTDKIEVKSGTDPINDDSKPSPSKQSPSKPSPSRVTNTQKTDATGENPNQTKRGLIRPLTVGGGAIILVLVALFLQMTKG